MLLLVGMEKSSMGAVSTMEDSCDFCYALPNSYSHISFFYFVYFIRYSVVLRIERKADTIHIRR